jgi:hypothetical protein
MFISNFYLRALAESWLSTIVWLSVCTKVCPDIMLLSITNPYTPAFSVPAL